MSKAERISQLVSARIAEENKRKRAQMQESEAAAERYKLKEQATERARTRVFQQSGVVEVFKKLSGQPILKKASVTGNPGDLRVKLQFDPRIVESTSSGSGTSGAEGGYNTPSTTRRTEYLDIEARVSDSMDFDTRDNPKVIIRSSRPDWKPENFASVGIYGNPPPEPKDFVVDDLSKLDETIAEAILWTKGITPKK